MNISVSIKESRLHAHLGRIEIGKDLLAGEEIKQPINSIVSGRSDNSLTSSDSCAYQCGVRALQDFSCLVELVDRTGHCILERISRLFWRSGSRIIK